MNLKYSHFHKEISINNNTKTIKLIVVLLTTNSFQIKLENTQWILMLILILGIASWSRYPEHLKSLKSNVN
jgi:hypothetical protein